MNFLGGNSGLRINFLGTVRGEGKSMNLTKKERKALLTTFVAVFEKLLDVEEPRLEGAGKKRFRRSRADAVKLREIVCAERRNNKPVKLIAKELGVTPAYVYVIANGKNGATAST